ncbi:hypothetical protein TrVE_jg7231 [Triparma verrucosa]|uniref:Uncharacterized protein n=1 Tax=Triparma verrucosa TaxID=1606542 RepID=A0A9W7F0K5_9STRA|nr:hypothetical protein TrVE_jg7231 [Triparma verrucosa]
MDKRMMSRLLSAAHALCTVKLVILMVSLGCVSAAVQATANIDALGETATASIENEGNNVAEALVSIPIQFPHALTSFDLHVGADVGLELERFRSFHNLDPQYFDLLHDFVRKEILLQGKAPFERAILGKRLEIENWLQACKFLSPQYRYLVNPQEVPPHSVVLEIGSVRRGGEICPFTVDSQNGVDVDIFLQHLRISYGLTGNWTDATGVQVEFEGGRTYYHRGSGAVSKGRSRRISSIPSADVTSGLELGSGKGSEMKRNCILIQPNQIVFNVFYDILKMAQCEQLIKCFALEEGSCKKAEVNALEGEVVVLGVHNLAPSEDVANFFPEGTILYNFEQVGDEGSKIDDSVMQIFRNARYRVWDYSNSNVEAFRRLGVEAEVVRLEYADSLKWREGAPKGEQDIDVLFYGTVTPYRRNIINELRAQGVQIFVVTDVTWGVYFELLDELIRRSKIVLVLNTFSGEGEWKMSRLGRLLANEVFCLVERNWVVEEGQFEGGVGWCDGGSDGGWGECVRRWLDYEERRRRVGAEGGRIWRGLNNE